MRKNSKARRNRAPRAAHYTTRVGERRNGSTALSPVHPGEILFEEFLKPLHLSMNQLSLDLHVPVTRIGEIVHGRRAITADTALRLGRYFDTTPGFWLNLQSKFDLDTAEDKLLSKVQREVQPRTAAA